jgi:hypothetical protein
VHGKVADVALTAVTAAQDETWIPGLVGKTPSQQARSNSGGVEDRTELGTALEELIDGQLLKPHSVLRV